MPATIVLPKSHLQISEVAKLELNGAPKRTIYSFSEWCPSTHKTCLMNNQAMQMAGRPIGVSVCSTSGYNKYRVFCKNCKEEMCTVYGTSAQLNDWRRVRYVSWHDSSYWYGLRGLNINPKTSRLTIECCCDPENRKEITNYLVEEIN